MEGKVVAWEEEREHPEAELEWMKAMADRKASMVVVVGSQATVGVGGSLLWLEVNRFSTFLPIRKGSPPMNAG